MPTIAGSRLMRAMTLLGGSGLVAGSLLAIALPAQAAVALKCGATITRSVTLSQNINCTRNGANDAITVLAAGVTVNLNGHKILGPGDSKDTGGVIDNGHDNVTVEDGTISNFWVGVNVTGSSTSEVTGLRIQNVTITENTLGDQNWGVYGAELRKASMTGLTIKNANIGVFLAGSQQCTVTSSHLASPLTGFEDEEGTGNSWSHTTMANVSYVGVYVLDSAKAVVTANAVTGGTNAWGIEDQSSANSYIAHNKLSGLDDGVEAYESSSETISSNSGSGNAYGIYSYDPLFGSVTGNVFSKGQYGIEADYPRSTVFRLNTTDDNSVAGIYVNAQANVSNQAAVVSHNTADKNQFGLYSTIHTTGGSNRAIGNTLVNCHNVACLKA